MVHLSVDICRNHGLWLMTANAVPLHGSRMAGLLAGRARLLRGATRGKVPGKRKDAQVRGGSVNPDTRRRTSANGRAMRIGDATRHRRVSGAPLRQGGRACSRTAQRPAGARDRNQQSQSRRRETQEGIGMRIRAMRKGRGLPQGVLARRCGISRDILGQIERGNENFRLATLLPIVRRLETTVADLFAGIA